MLLLAIVSVSLDPITSLNITGRLSTDVACSGECRLIVGSLQHVDGSYAVSARGGACGETLFLEHIPFGAHLTPLVTFSCNGQLRAETGPAVTIAPYLTNAVVGEDTVWVPALAEPRGAERVHLHLWGEGVDAGGDFPTRELVLRKVTLPSGKFHIRSTLEPYGAASNTRTLVREEPSDHFVATQVGCSTGMGFLPLVFFRRRRFPFPRGFC